MTHFGHMHNNLIQPYAKSFYKIGVILAAGSSRSLSRCPIYKIGIIANQSRGSEERLKSYGLLKYIDLVFSSEEEGVSKPDLRLFKLALSKVKIVSNEAIMIGDRLDNDIYPAKKVGMKTIWVKQGLGAVQKPKSEEYKADYEVDKLSDILEILL